MPPARTTALLLAGALVAVLLGVAAWSGTTSPTPAATTAADRDAVAERGEDVMGFDLDATVHRFDPTTTGGVEEVLARDPADQEEVSKVRDHLREEAERWQAGDFSAPAAIHGEDMPGLQELQAAGDLLEIKYTELPTGARVVFTSTDPTVVDALHAWFDAQLNDHGDHAEHG